MAHRQAARRPTFQALREVVVTGVGTILANCDSRELFWQQLHDGQSQMAIEPDPC
jgi:hypothetical protein